MESTADSGSGCGDSRRSGIDTDEKNSAEMPDQGVESEADEDLLEYEVTVTAQMERKLQVTDLRMKS